MKFNLKSLKPLHYVVIVQAVLLIVAIIGWVAKPSGKIVQEKIDYEIITLRVNSAVADLYSEIDILKARNMMLIGKVDSMRQQFPKHQEKLDRIKREIKKINAYPNHNYSDSSSTTLLNRLSR
jgi:hypothetical protein